MMFTAVERSASALGCLYCICLVGSRLLVGLSFGSWLDNIGVLQLMNADQGGVLRLTCRSLNFCA